MNIEILSEIDFLESESLARFSTFGTGGLAKLIVEPSNLSELRSVLRFAEMESLPFFVVGGGSNTVFSENGFNGIIISMKSYELDFCCIEGDLLRVSAGVMLPYVLPCLAKAGKSALEFLAGIPGTVGGALFQNASFGGVAISDVLRSVDFFSFSNHEVMRCLREELDFDYRVLRNFEGIILNAEFNLKSDFVFNIRSKMRKNVQYRLEEHDLGFPSVGCVFKNPANSDYSAGRMIDLCGLKGLVLGGAKISDKHANYIVNVNNASSDDFIGLVDKIRDAVMSKFGCELELEIKYVE